MQCSQVLALATLWILVLVSELPIHGRLVAAGRELGHLPPAGRHPQEVVLLELVNLREEGVEPRIG